MLERLPFVILDDRVKKRSHQTWAWEMAAFGTSTLSIRRVLPNRTAPASKRLLSYCRNPRKNDHALDRMVASILEFGFAIPILARSDGQVIDGHLRLKGAQKLVFCI